MKRCYMVVLALSAALAVVAVQPVRGQGGEFLIQNADATNTLSFTSSSGLEAAMDEAAPRFVMEFANANQYYTLTPIPTALDDLLEGLQPRFVMAFANANRFYDMTPIPGQLDTLLGRMAPRFVIEFANANRLIRLQYPVELIDDDRPPEASSVEVAPSGQTRATISWTTDEYADSAVECGTRSGTYTMSFSDPLYVKVHRITLTGLTPEMTYYCQASSTDLSGNTYRSQEFSFEQGGESFIYLPLVLRS